MTSTFFPIIAPTRLLVALVAFYLAVAQQKVSRKNCIEIIVWNRCEDPDGEIKLTHGDSSQAGSNQSTANLTIRIQVVYKFNKGNKYSYTVSAITITGEKQQQQP